MVESCDKVTPNSKVVCLSSLVHGWYRHRFNNIILSVAIRLLGVIDDTQRSIIFTN